MTAASRAIGRPTALHSRVKLGRLGSGLRPQYDFERGASPGRAADAEAALDRRRPVAHVPQPVPGGSEVGREAFAVVLDRDEPLAGGALSDHDLRARRMRMAADVSEA